MHDALEPRWNASMAAQARFARQARATEDRYEVGINRGFAIAEHGVRALLIDVDVALIEVAELIETRRERVRSFIAEAVRRGDDSWGGTSIDHWEGVLEGLAFAAGRIDALHIDHTSEELLDDEVSA